MKRTHDDSHSTAPTDRKQGGEVKSLPSDSTAEAKKGQPHFEARHFYFTAYIHTPETYPGWCDWITRKLKSAKGYGYLVVNPEICPTTGRFHLQGYVQTLRSAKKASTVQNFIGDRTAHIKKPSGDATSNRKYCTKQESRAPGLEPFEWGEFNERAGTEGGAPSTLKAVGDDIVNHKRSIFQISKEQPDVFMRHCNGMKALAAMHGPKRSHDVKINLAVFCGVAGAGKTTDCEAWCETFGKPIFRKMKGTKWDGYAGEETILFEEFGSEEGWSATDFNALVQKGPHKSNSRYVHHEMLATNFAFNSNQHPNEWFPGSKPEQMAGVYRRINEGTYFNYTVSRPGHSIKFEDLQRVERHPDIPLFQGPVNQHGPWLPDDYVHADDVPE